MQAHKNVSGLSIDNPFLKIGRKAFEKELNFCEKKDEIFQSVSKIK